MKDISKYLAECEQEIRERRQNGKSENTCKGCVRCERVDESRIKTLEHPTGWHCMCKSYYAGILPSDPACDIYWDREKYEIEKNEKAEKREKERLARWEKNKNNPPMKLPIVFDGYGYIPECPNCHDMPYSTEKCHWCGQRFKQDEEVKEYSKPLVKETKCILCGAPVLIRISRYNGHKSCHCKKCGAVWME